MHIGALPPASWVRTTVCTWSVGAKEVEKAGSGWLLR